MNNLSFKYQIYDDGSGTSAPREVFLGEVLVLLPREVLNWKKN